MIKKNKRLVGILLAVSILLFLPLIAMKLNDEVNWTLFDFVIAGIFLLIAGLTLEIILRNVKLTKFRIAFCATAFLLFFLAWIELAVGIFESVFSGR